MFIPVAYQEQFDPNAGAFINATGISGLEAQAVNQLVNNLKSAGLWGYMRAIYPMVGGSAFAHKFNLVNVSDTDAAFRLNFVGGWTHSSSGAKPDGVAGTYANTFFVPNVNFPSNSQHISYYSFTNNAAATMVEIGATDAGAAGECLLAFRFTDSNQYAFIGKGGGSGGAPGNSFGFMIANRTTVCEGWKNGTRVVNTGGYIANTARSFYLGAQNDGTVNTRNSSRGCSFASIGASMPSGDAVTFTNIVNNFQKTLGRNVF
jgi:hypothetical protein